MYPDYCFLEFRVISKWSWSWKISSRKLERKPLPDGVLWRKKNWVISGQESKTQKCRWKLRYLKKHLLWEHGISKGILKITGYLPTNGGGDQTQCRAVGQVSKRAGVSRWCPCPLWVKFLLLWCECMFSLGKTWWAVLLWCYVWMKFPFSIGF